jgi:hypothetical protein
MVAAAGSTRTPLDQQQHRVQGARAPRHAGQCAKMGAVVGQRDHALRAVELVAAGGPMGEGLHTRKVRPSALLADRVREQHLAAHRPAAELAVGLFLAVGGQHRQHHFEVNGQPHADACVVQSAQGLGDREPRREVRQVRSFVAPAR